MLAKRTVDLIAALGVPSAESKVHHEQGTDSLEREASPIVPVHVETKVISQNKRKKNTGGVLYLTLSEEEEETLRALCYRTRKSRAHAAREALRDFFEKYRFTI